MDLDILTLRFVAELKDLYGDDYDYSQVEYVNLKTPVTLVCKKHGVFTKKPAGLKKGAGCPVCSKERKIQKMKASYSKEDYQKRAEKRRKTMIEKYGVENPMQIASVQKKHQKSVLDHYGVDNPRKSQEIVDRGRETCLEKYGATHYHKSDEAKAHMREIMTERYGVDNYMKSDAHFLTLESALEKSRQTQLERYGAEHYSQSDEAKRTLYERKQKEYMTKVLNHTFNTSSVEDELYQMLCEKFGVNDVVRQYLSEVYPYRCDFYIKSRNLYLELNAGWMHGGMWYCDSDLCSCQFCNWNLKACNNQFYRNSLETWTVRDVKKRQSAAEHQLNYVVFWSNDLSDAKLWFSLGCPDGQDWDHEYSWMPSRMIGN